MEKFPQITEAITSPEPTGQEALMNDISSSPSSTAEVGQWAQVFAPSLEYPQFDFQGHGIPDNPYWFNQASYDAQYSPAQWGVSQEQQSPVFSQDLATEQLEFKEGDSEPSSPQETAHSSENIPVWGPALPPPENLAPIESNESKEETPDLLKKQLVERMLVAFADETNYIGEGASGRVYTYESTEGESGVDCAKVIAYPESYKDQDKGNHPLREFELHDAIRLKIGHEFAPMIPQVYDCIPCDNDLYVMTMEQMEATDLRRAIAGELAFPENFDPNGFILELRKIIGRLHKIGYVHNDLYPRNVMIDNTSALPRLIDFGRTIELSDLDQSPNAKAIRRKEMQNINNIHNELLGLFDR